MKIWKGRVNPGPNDALLHQRIQALDMTNDLFQPLQPSAYVILGFCSDEGVRRNLGRVGARNTPDLFRKAASHIAIHRDQDHAAILDAGNVICSNQKLEKSQELLAQKIARLVSNDFTPIVIGGGHETAFGHFMGLKHAIEQGKKIGIINLDAHFDLRAYEKGAHSGSPFRQIADVLKEEFFYLPIGIRPEANTASLFQFMEEKGQHYIFLQDLHADFKSALLKLTRFIERVDHIYLSIDMDCFAAAYAPGVSASAPDGLLPWQANEFIQVIHGSGKLLSADIVEINPDYDIDNRTMKLAAELLFQLLHGENLLFT